MKNILSAFLMVVFLLTPFGSAFAQSNSYNQTQAINALPATANTTITSQIRPLLTIQVNSAPQITSYTLPDGQIFTNQTQFANELTKIIQSSKIIPDIVLNITSYSQAQLLTSSSKMNGVTAIAARWGFGFKISNYFVRFSLEKGVLKGCINKNVWHVGMMISRQGSSSALIDFHLAVWKGNGGPQLGLYNSGNIGKFCTKTQLNYNNVWNGIYLASAALLGSALAKNIANTAASSVYVILRSLPL